jgi:hypothetical protein
MPKPPPKSWASHRRTTIALLVVGLTYVPVCGGIAVGLAALGSNPLPVVLLALAWLATAAVLG